MRRRALPVQLNAQLVVVGVIRERYVGQEAARFVLQVAEHAQVRDAIGVRLHVAIQHRAVRADSETMRRAMHVDVLGPAELLVGDLLANGGTERLGTAAGHRVQTCLAQRDEHVLPRHLLDARDVRDLDGRERLDVDVRKLALERTEHRRVVLEPRLHIEAADDVELLRQAVAGRLGLGEDLLERVPVRAVFLRQPRIPAEDAGLPQDADVRRVDVLIRREGDDVAVLRAVHRVRQRADA